MGKRKDVTIEVPTTEIEAKVFPPKIEITNKEFVKRNWKYLAATWALIAAIAVIGCFLPWPLCPIFSIVLSIGPFYFGTRAITRHTKTEITS